MIYALHEVLEVHEIAMFKAICATKSKTMQLLVSDPQLKEIMQADVDVSARQLQELSAILAKAKQ